MNFCTICDNMYYMKISDDDDNKLIYYCRNCGNENKNLHNTNTSILRQNFKKQDKEYNNLINKYTKFDPTLPRIDSIPCPNNECLSNTDADKHKREVIYIRYDDTNLKYLYLCACCDNVWKSS